MSINHFQYYTSGISLFKQIRRGYWHQMADERLGDPTPRCIQEPLVVRDGDERPQEDPLAVHCFCVCIGSCIGRSPWGKQIHGTWCSLSPVNLS